MGPSGEGEVSAGGPPGRHLPADRSAVRLLAAAQRVLTNLTSLSWRKGSVGDHEM